MSETSIKKDVQKLQRVIVDALEDVKATHIVVFNTEHISSLFERVIIASGSSNRQTKALAANVREQVRSHGFAKPRVEGEDNGEWIIVDCGAAVAHIMQPSIREYYHLEEIWGEKPVRLKLGAPKPVMSTAKVHEKPLKSQKLTKTSNPKAPAAKGAKGLVASGKAQAKKTSTSSAAKATAKTPAKTRAQSKTSTASAKSNAAPRKRSKPKA
jgi:ribosome-associated protein